MNDSNSNEQAEHSSTEPKMMVHAHHSSTSSNEAQLSNSILSPPPTIPDHNQLQNVPAILAPNTQPSTLSVSVGEQSSDVLKIPPNTSVPSSTSTTPLSTTNLDVPPTTQQHTINSVATSVPPNNYHQNAAHHRQSHMYGATLLLPKSTATAPSGPQLQQHVSNSIGVASTTTNTNLVVPHTAANFLALQRQQLLQRQQAAVVAAAAAASNMAIASQQHHHQLQMAATAAAMGQSASYPHLRSGKWLPAEENYALLLVALFERGMITDCVDGTTTLRTYLSQKLHCAPMRISKKFAGRGIGKLIYASKAIASSPNGQQKIPELLERLRIAEQQFLQAAYPPPVTGVVPYSLLQVPPNSQQHVPLFPTSMMPGMVPNPKIIPPSMPTATTPVAPGFDVIPLTTGSETSIPPIHTTELHESYLRALQQADDDDEDAVSKNPNSAQEQSNVGAIPTTPATTEIPDLLSGFEKIVQGIKVAPIATDTTTQHPPPTETTFTTSSEYSPPFTSRSFDEFHRFLGKDEISLLDSTLPPPPPPLPDAPHVNQNTHVTVSTMTSDRILPNQVIALDTNALFSAESYSLLTQESSLEASRRGTYPMPLPDRTRNNANDIENILQQVHSHRTHREPPRKGDTMSTNSSFYDSSISNPSSVFHDRQSTNPPMNVTITNHSSNVGPLSNPPSTKAPSSSNGRNHHVTAISQSEDVNIVSGSDPSGGSSSSRSNTSNTSSGTDTTGGTTSNEDDGSEEEGLTSSGAEFDSAEDDDNNNNTNDDSGNIKLSAQDKLDSPHSSPQPSRKRVKGIHTNSHSNSNQQQRRGDGATTTTKRVKFQ